MSKMKLNVMFAGVLVACAFGGVAIGIAWATGGHDFVGTVIAGPSLLDEIDDKGETDSEEIELKTSGLWESRIMSFSVKPGGHSGWHSHPGLVFVMITHGTMTLTQADDLENPHVYTVGDGFMEEISRVHLAENRSEDEVLTFEAFLLTPAGGPIRVDEPAP